MVDKPLHVALFVTCLVDLFRPSVGFAAVKLLEDAGCVVHVPELQTCCGQPAYNAGARGDARDIAAQVIEAFEPYEAVVAPSGSCAGMLRKHYPLLFADDPALAPKARALADRTYELVSFLVRVRGVTQVNAEYAGLVAYHPSCSSLRELGVEAEPRTLLATVDGLDLVELEEAETCCGFGGTFAVKYADISLEMTRRKVERVLESGADTLLAADLGCLMNLAGALSRSGARLAVRHVAEVLADMADGPAIGEPAAPHRAAETAL